MISRIYFLSRHENDFGRSEQADLYHHKSLQIFTSKDFSFIQGGGQ